MTESTETRGDLTVRWEQFDRLCAARGWTNDPQRATGLEIGYQTLNHIRNGRLRPGGIFLRRCLATFGSAAYDDLFEVSV